VVIRYASPHFKDTPFPFSNGACDIVRSSILAGTWYAGGRDALTKQVKTFLNKAEAKPVPGRIIAIIVPHAGYMYSGQCAAYGFKLLEGKSYKRVIILAPTHQAYFRGATVSNVDYYQTPLGLVPVDSEACRALLAQDLFQTNPSAESYEHAVEIELPFLQLVLKDFKILPLIIGEVNKSDITSIASALKKYLDEETLIVVSSDFTHYGPNYGYIPFPATGEVRSNLQKLDMGAIDKIISLDLDGFLSYKSASKITICGANPIAILLAMLPQEAKGKLLHHSTSGDVIGDYKNCVCYAAIAFSIPTQAEEKTAPEQKEEATAEEEKEGKGAEEAEKVKSSDFLTESEQRTLLKLARDTLNMYIKERKTPDPSKYTLTEHLKQPRGVFVTLEKNGNLRGCIGYIMGMKPLYQGVIDNTINAATRDPRFAPVSEEELSDIEIEISVLTPLRRISQDEVDKIEIGKHGILIKRGFYQGILLPQVATEYGWDRDTFLAQTCRKAGLPPSAERMAGSCNRNLYLLSPGLQ